MPLHDIDGAQAHQGHGCEDADHRGDDEDAQLE